ncbi:TonB-dependent receptor [Cellvibrio sp.]
MNSFKHNNKSRVFARSLLALSISSSLYGGVAIAAEEQMVEEVVVTGIRASVQRAMDVKRNAAGVVDAISAEDMGKFPDTNLAESLQRITGVSISRSNGEGSQITVRGFGGSNNMVTLNGRTLPSGGSTAAYGGGTIGRAFDFGNLASESVKAVEVYKTGKASVATGGIGATVNIITNKPIETDGLVGTVGGKLVNDSTNERGDDITPELSGLVSFANDDQTLGVSLSASHQVRDSGQSGLTENNWNIRQWVTPGQPGSLSTLNSAEIINPPEVGQLYALPNDLRYHFVDNHRERNNAQLTLQFKPTEKLLGTLDYTYAENQIEEARGDKTVWLQGNITKIVFDKNPDVAGPLSLEQAWNFPKDNSYAQTSGNVTNTLKSLGVNLEFEATDRLTLMVDAHDSELEGGPEEAYGSAVRSGMAVAIGSYTTFDFSKKLPQVTNLINDSVKGNSNGIADIGDVSSTVFDFTYARQKMDVSQVKFDAKYEFDSFILEGGVETRNMQSAQQQSSWQKQGGGNSVAFPMDIPDELIENYNYVGGFDDFNTAGYQTDGFRADAVKLAEWGAATYGAKAAVPWGVAYNPNFSTNTIIEEETAAAYVQFGFESELFSRPVNLLAGVRYETTDVASSNSMLVPTEVTWTDNNDFLLVRSTTPTMYAQKSDYDNLLPSVDFDIALTSEIKARASYSTTISRAGYGNLTSGATISATGGLNQPTGLGGQPVASSQNPALLPLESDNFDVSVEYYFDDASYVSIGFFEKHVENFIGSEQVYENHFGLLDATAGPRAQQAAAALQAINQPVTEDSLFVMTAILDNPQDFPNGAADFKTPAQDPTFWGSVATKYDISPEAGDPELLYLTTKPINNKEAKINGVELAAQHFFGESGFGIQGNYTIVNGDIGYNNASPTNITQFALTGLSDTANLVLMYENEVLQARVAYNWRDAYLAGYTSSNPTYVEDYAQIDMNVSYEVTDNITLSFEGLNLTGEDSRAHGRTELLVWNIYDLGPRYQLGARYDF